MGFDLRPWQADDIIRPIFGWVDENGHRKFRTAYVELPRKNGKSELAAGIALKLLVADKEQGAEIYGAACDRDQASLVFNVAAEMVRRQPHLSKLLKIIDSQKRIIYPKNGSFYRAIPADAAGSHGFNASGVIFDEVHAQPSRELWDVLTTSTSAREQPLVFAITTAGFDRTSICWELHERAEQVLNGTLDLPSFFAYIRALPEDMDWTDENNWAIANPALDDFRSRDELREAVRAAVASPAMQNTVRRLYFNQWTNSEARWFDPTAWRDCGGLIGDVTNQVCYGGLDLASTTDFAAWCLYFPEGHKVIAQIYMPEDTAGKQGPMRSQFLAWAQDGWLTLTPGNVIDYDYIKAQILKDFQKYQILEIGYDPWSATQVATQLSGEGVLMVPVRQGFATLSAPSKYLETLVAKGELNHGGNPVLAWMSDNCVVETDAGANIKPSKKHSTQKIDGIVALVTALERAVVAETAAEVAFISF